MWKVSGVCVSVEGEWCVSVWKSVTPRFQKLKRLGWVLLADSGDFFSTSGMCVCVQTHVYKRVCGTVLASVPDPRMREEGLHT